MTEHQLFYHLCASVTNAQLPLLKVATLRCPSTSGFSSSWWAQAGDHRRRMAACDGEPIAGNQLGSGFYFLAIFRFG
jgi:hypothetical protein